MKTLSTLLKAFVFTVLFSVIVNGLFAQKGHTGPAKSVNCVAIDNFVNQAFELNNKISLIATTIGDILEKAKTSGPSLDLIQQLNDNYSSLQGILPTVESLVNASVAIPDNLKYVSVFKYVLAAKNIKAAIEALLDSKKQITNLVSTIIPDAKKKVAPDNTSKTGATVKI